MDQNKEGEVTAWTTPPPLPLTPYQGPTPQNTSWMLEARQKTVTTFNQSFKATAQAFVLPPSSLFSLLLGLVSHIIHSLTHRHTQTEKQVHGTDSTLTYLFGLI